MEIPIYAGKEFNASVAGSRIVEVCCEKCQTRYFYELLRHGAGSASAHYYIAQDRAKRKAQEAAAGNLAAKLHLESELVACPSCGWINDSLIIGYRRTRFRWMVPASVIIGLIVTLVIGLWTIGDIQYGPENPRPNWWGYGIAAWVGTIVLGFLLRRMLLKLIQPNHRFPLPPVLPAGTPRAWVAVNTATGTVPSPQQTASSTIPGWVVYRKGKLVIPQICCECMGPSTTIFKTPTRPSGGLDNQKDAPLCASCAARLRLKWWLVALRVAAFGVACAAIVYFLNDSDMRLVRSILAGCFGLTIGAIAAQQLVSFVYQTKLVDSARGIYRVRFTNAQYTEKVRIATEDAENTAMLNRLTP